MNILVTGADGQLGRCLRDVTASSADHYIFTDVAQLDITDPAAVRRAVADNKPAVIVNCAAYTDVERAESDPRDSRALNATAVAVLAKKQPRGSRAVSHIDRLCVRAGPSNPCREDQQGTPTGVYGLTKLHGEQAITRLAAARL